MPRICLFRRLAGQAHRVAGELLFFLRDQPPQRLRVVLSGGGEVSKRSLCQGFAPWKRGQTSVAQSMDELQSPEGVEPCVQVSPEGGLIVRLRHGFADRLKCPELPQRFHQQVGPEKRIALLQDSEDLREVSSRSRDLSEHVEPARQVREDQRVKEAKVGEASFLRDEVPDRAAGAEGHAVGRAALEKDG